MSIDPAVTRRLTSLGLLCGLALFATLPLAGQGAVDPNVAPRAASLERAGDWDGAIELLGRYLATAPTDGSAWFQFGRMYLLAARRTHAPDPNGVVTGPEFLELSSIALDRAVELGVDSGVVFRGLVEMERALNMVEAYGWDATRSRLPWAHSASLPPFVAELGVNLLHSCPADGVLVTGSDLEAVAVWYASLQLGQRSDVFPLLPGRYATDPNYRAEAARSMGIQQAGTMADAIRLAASQRPLCLAPSADTMGLDFIQWKPQRLVLVANDAATVPSDVLSVTELIRSVHQRPTAWTRDVRALYDEAARRNPMLCAGLLAYLGGDRPTACGR